MNKFPACDCPYATPCVFTEESLNRLHARHNSGGYDGFARCPRHGALITSFVRGHDIADARKRAKNLRECPDDFSNY